MPIVQGVGVCIRSRCRPASCPEEFTVEPEEVSRKCLAPWLVGIPFGVWCRLTLCQLSGAQPSGFVVLLRQSSTSDLGGLQLGSPECPPQQGAQATLASAWLLAQVGLFLCACFLPIASFQLGQE